MNGGNLKIENEISDMVSFFISIPTSPVIHDQSTHISYLVDMKIFLFIPFFMVFMFICSVLCE